MEDILRFDISRNNDNTYTIILSKNELIRMYFSARNDALKSMRWCSDCFILNDIERRMKTDKVGSIFSLSFSLNRMKVLRKELGNDTDINIEHDVDQIYSIHPDYRRKKSS